MMIEHTVVLVFKTHVHVSLNKICQNQNGGGNLSNVSSLSPTGWDEHFRTGLNSLLVNFCDLLG